MRFVGNSMLICILSRAIPTGSLYFQQIHVSLSASPFSDVAWAIGITLSQSRVLDCCHLNRAYVSYACTPRISTRGTFKCREPAEVAWVAQRVAQLYLDTSIPRVPEIKAFGIPTMWHKEPELKQCFAPRTRNLTLSITAPTLDVNSVQLLITSPLIWAATRPCSLAGTTRHGSNCESDQHTHHLMDSLT